MGMVQNAYRPGQQVGVLRLAQLEAEAVDMFTLLIVGNASTRIVPGSGDTPDAYASGARILTPRGYMDKYGRQPRALIPQAGR